MSEINRLYRYRELLMGRRFVTRDEFLNKLEISLATFKRDLAKLRDQFDMPLVFDADLGGYRLEKNDDRQELPGLWFSQDEMLALLTIQRMIEQLEPGLLGPKLKPLQQRLNSMLQSQGLDPDTLTERLRLVHAGKRHLPLQAFETVARATLSRRQVRIRHHNRNTGETLTRIISPQQLVHYRDNWYVDAWCHLRKSVRSFSIDAIEQADMLDDAAKDIDLEAMREMLNAGYGIFGGVISDWAELRFTAQRAPWVQNEVWHPQQQGVLHADGSYTLRVPYADERELIGDILRFGADVEVVAPERMRRKVKQHVEKLRNLYF